MEKLSILCKIPPPLSDNPDLKYRQILDNVQKLDNLLQADTTLFSSPDILPYLASVLRPPPELIPAERYLEDDPLPSPETWIHFHKASEAALSVLSQALLQKPASESEKILAVVALATYTEPSDYWTTPTSHQLASRTLSLHPVLSAPRTLSWLLFDVIKPLFTKATSSAHQKITPLGRIAQRPSANKGAALHEIQPWSSSPELPTVLHHIIRTLSPSEIESSWPLIIPPLLTILDSPNPHHKALACSILTTLLRRFPPSLLRRTGLGPVFWDAVIPCLLCLPPLTPQSQSIPLLAAAYTTMRALAEVRTTTLQSRAQLLDVVVRSGILRGMSFVGDNVELAGTLIRELQEIVQDMGIYSVKHLKEILKMVNTILTNPFATTYPPLLITTLELLRVTTTICWPRFPRYIPTTLKGVTTCWKRVLLEECGDKEGNNTVKEKLRDTVRILRAVDNDGMMQLERAVIDADERFKELFTWSE